MLDFEVQVGSLCQDFNIRWVQYLHPPDIKVLAQYSILLAVSSHWFNNVSDVACVTVGEAQILFVDE